MKFLSLFLSLFILCGCSNVESKKHIIPIHEYSEVENKIIDYMDVFNQKEKMYEIYYFQENCYHCLGIKSLVIEYALRNISPIYFIRITDDKGFISNDPEETVGTNNPLKAFCKMTPQLSQVKDGYILNTIVGHDDIKSYLSLKIGQ